MKKALKWVGIVLGSLVGIAALGVGVLFCMSLWKESTAYAIDVEGMALPTDEAALAEGERLYVARGCSDCHQADGTGRVIIDGAPCRITGANLTTTSDWPVEDHVRAIRHGVAPDGRPLMLMPSQEYWAMSDADVAKIIAHYTRLPRREVRHEPNEARFLGRCLHGAGLFPMYSAERIEHDAPRPTAPEPAETIEYGAHLAVGCTGCHGDTFSGGAIPGAPPEMGVPANLTPHETGLASWSREDFLTALREGRRPDGTELNPEQMPFVAFGRMTDTELNAIWLYLESLPPIEEGNR